MDQIENRHWPAFIIIALIGFSFWWVSKSWNTDRPINIEDISYEMPRPKLVVAEYDISGRRIVRNLTPAESRAQIVNPNTAIPKPIGQDSKIAKQVTADAKKKAEAKKAGQNIRKAQLAVRFQSNGGKSGLSVNSIPQTQSPQVPAPPQPQASAEVEAPLPNLKDDELKKTAEQWRALLFSAPTVVKNGKDFYKAFQDGEVSADAFYKITGELLADTGADRQKLSLFIFRMDSSVKTFTLLVTHYTERTPEVLRTQIYAILKTYGDLPRFTILSQLLGSSNKRVAVLASEVLRTTITAQEQIGKAGLGRSPGAAPIPPRSFQTFLPVLRRLVKEGDASAQTLLTSIEALMTTSRTA